MGIADTLLQLWNQTLDSVDQSFAHVEPLIKIYNVIKIRPAVFIIVFFILALISLGTGIFSHVFVSVVAMIYPAYATFKVF